MKRIVCILLAGLLLTCAGCGGKENQKTEAPAETAAADTAEQEKQAAEQPAAQATERAAAPAAEPAKPAASGDAEGLQFETTDLDGNPVNTADLYAQHRITMVNVWGTWCGPCVGEMPELAVMAEEFAEKDVGLIAVCTDAMDAATIADAKEILADAGVGFPVLAGFKGQDELFQMFAYPTSFFVDREGHVLGSVIGAAPQQYRDTVEQLLKEVE